MASDFALKGIPVRVNELAPGRFLSELSYSKEEEDEMAKNPYLALNPPPVKRVGRYAVLVSIQNLRTIILTSRPLSGGIYYREEEMAATAIYLASDASGFMNGQSMLIDGGLTLVNP